MLKIEEIEARPGVSFGTDDLMNSGVANEARVSAMELDSAALRSEGFQEFEVSVRVSVESNNNINGVYDEMDAADFEEEKNKMSVNGIDSGDDDHLESQDCEFDDRNDGTSSGVTRVGGQMEVHKSLLSEFDDYLANEKANAGTSRALSYGFEIGDMVWGKVKSHPWWPGHIFNEDFASSSVRRTRRDAHVLVAFFGDSSYGWFDPAELIPFESNLMEKSRQMNSRTFVKAVEEAVDEASRRRGLALACRCRNPYNFRPTNVQGYLTVDVPGFEPGTVYSADLIKKARDAFQPAETLSFVRKLASCPLYCDQMSIDCIKNKATISVFRKAVFEEFDETYGQAFGEQPTRPSQDCSIVLAHSKTPPKVPLSGPLVIAETLSTAKNLKKNMKVKDNLKNGRFLLKRRDEPSDSFPSQIGQGQAGFLSPSAVMEGSRAVTAGDYVLQKRAQVPQTTVKFEQTEFISKETTCLIGDPSGKEAVASVQAATAFQDATLDAHEVKMKMAPDVCVDNSRIDMSRGKEEVMLDKKHESAKMTESFEVLLESKPSLSLREEGCQRIYQVRESGLGAHPFLVGGKLPAKRSPEGILKKPKSLKRPLGDLSSDKSMMVVPKKKKKNTELNVQTNSDLQQKRSSPNSTKLSARAGLMNRKDVRMNYQKKDGAVAMSPGVATVSIEVGLPQLLRDLHALALDPFHGSERACPATIQKCFLRFRSLVFQKSLVLSPQSEIESTGVRAKSSSNIGTSSGIIRDFPASKPVKQLARPDDPTKAGRKRLPSDRQEEMAAKRLKKINQMKSLTAGKKSSQRTLDGQGIEGKEYRKEHAAVPPPRPVKPGFAKKLQSPSRAVEPTMVVMKFPPETSLPSAAELKARFGRFGSLDQSAIRVFWKTFTCRVVFKHKADAQAAYMYANGNNSLFGNVKVRYILRDVGAPASEVPDFDKSRGDDSLYEIPRVEGPMAERPSSASGLLQPNIQLKSCLKKPTGDESGQVNSGNGNKTARVTFMLGGEESYRREQMVVGDRNNFTNINNASFADGGAASSSIPMDFNSKNFQKVFPTHSQFGKPSYNNTHLTEVASPINSHNLNTPTIPPPVPLRRLPSIDISQQMLSLLTRCNDVVTNVTGFLGYVPYRPL